jgi:hypothetical protein
MKKGKSYHPEFECTNPRCDFKDIAIFGLFPGKCPKCKQNTLRFTGKLEIWGEEEEQGE